MCMMVICGKNFKRMTQPFLSEPDNLALQLNFDGFQPWKRRVYSVDAVYLTILNLPRSERYKKENCILVALIPPHCEGKGNMQKFLRCHAMNRLLIPLIDELKQLWNTGVIMQRGTTGTTLVRACPDQCCM